MNRAINYVLTGAALIAVLAVVAGQCIKPPQPETKVEAVAEQQQSRASEVEAKREVRRKVTRQEQTPTGPVTTTTEDVQIDTGRQLQLDLDWKGTAVTIDQKAAPARPDWRLGVTAGWKPGALQLQPSLYGVNLERRIAGPVWLGAWARNDKSFGLSLSVEK